MFLTKSSTSFLLLLQYLVIPSLLLTSCFSLETVTKEQMSSEDRQLLLDLFTLSQSNDGLISSGASGKVYLLPEDNTKEVRLQVVSEEDFGKLEVTEMEQVFSDRDAQLEGNPRLAPTLHRSMFVKMKNGDIFVILIYERFRGDLTVAIKDARFNMAMLQFSGRLDFYARMMDSFGEIAKLKMKHCLLTPENLMYKEKLPDWGANYFESEEKLSYFPVIKGFKRTVGWGQSCEGSWPEYSDPEEYLKEIRYYDSDKAKVEIYSMALIILFMETSFFGNFEIQLELQDVFAARLGALSGYSQELAAYIGAESPFTNHAIYFIFHAILQLNKAWNEKTVNYSHDKLKSDIKFLISGMNVFYEYLLTKNGADANEIQNLLAEYKKFTDILLTMVRKNNVNMNKRPSTDEIIQKFIKIQTTTIVLESTLGARRSLLLI